MKNRLTFLVGILVLAVLLAYMLMFQVRYDEWTVVSTFGRADEDSVKDAPRLYFKWPPPIQKTSKYSKLIQMTEDELEEVATSDNHVVIIKTYLAWRIDEPLAFFNKLGDLEQAEARLRPMMRDIRGVFSGFRFTDMVNPDPTRVRLTQMEDQATGLLQEKSTREGLGLKIERLGIRRILVPEKITESVFERMKQERIRMAENARSSGKSQATKITEEAENISNQILSFANRLAGTIRLEGDKEAAQYLKEFRKDPDLAIFLRWAETQKILKHRSTFILPIEWIISPDYMLNTMRQVLNRHSMNDRRVER